MFHEEKAMIMRNRKRKLSRLKNRVAPQGHQYSSDQKQDTRVKLDEKKSRDPSRKAIVIRLPYISNEGSSNCFISSVLQILRHTNISRSLLLCYYHRSINVMKLLNSGESVSNPETIN